MPEQAIDTPAIAESRSVRREASAKGRRKWLRRASTLMIVGGLLLLAYPIATWGYPWFEQRNLRQRLEQQAPQLAISSQALQAAQFTAAAPAAASTAPGLADPASSAAAEAEASRLAQLAAFKAAADKFAAEVGWKEGTPLGRVVVPSIGVDVVMVEGTGNGDLREGPGHWPEKPFPGQGGNFVVSGHRTTYGAPFRKLNSVKEGDQIFLVLPYGVARYTVSRIVIVNPKELESVAQAGKEQVSLAARHPIYSAKQRIVVQGDLVGFYLAERSSEAPSSSQPQPSP